MGMFERNKLDTKLRETALRTILVYKDLAKSLNQDPLKLRRLSSKGVPFTGKELGKKLGVKSKDLKGGGGTWDSVWWVEADPNTGRVTNYVKIGDDFGKWSKRLNRQLDKWGQKSELAKLRKKRWITAGVIAAVVTAAVVVTVLSLGTAGAPAAAAATGTAKAAGGGLLAKAGKGLAKAGKGIGKGLGRATSFVGDKGKDILQSFNQIAPSLDRDASLDETSNMAMASLSPENQQLLQQTTLSDTSGGVAAAPAWVMPVAIVGGVGVLGTVIYFATKK